MAVRFDLHLEDERELHRIRLELIGRRHGAGVTQERLAQAVGRSQKWLNELERGISLPHLASLQEWAFYFDLRVQPCLELPDFAGVPVPFLIDQQLQVLWSHAKRFDAAPWVRAWCVAELAWERCWRGLSAAELSRRMGLSVSAVAGWERDGDNPLVGKIFNYARALGGRMRFELVERLDWGQG